MSSTPVYAVSLIFVLILFNARAVPLLKSHSMLKRDTTSEVIESVVEVKTFAEGHTIELQCNADGPAPPVIHWLKNGVHVEQGPLDHFADSLLVPEPEGEVAQGNNHYTVSNLVIKSATIVDAGKYACVADTERSRVSKSFEVRITPAEIGDQPNKRDLSNDVRIYLWSESVLEEQGTQSRLICRATQGPNRPLPDIRWDINDVVVNSENEERLGVEVLRSGDLQFIASSSMHLAFIKCVATGLRGDTDTKEPFLYVMRPSSSEVNK